MIESTEHLLLPLMALHYFQEMGSTESTADQAEIERLEEHASSLSSLPVAAWLSHRGVADLGPEAAVVGLEGVADELRAVVGDDAVGHAKTADQAPDELYRRFRRPHRVHGSGK